jgi:hypothetical protein
MTGAHRRDPGSRVALYERVLKTLERSAELAERHAQRDQRDGRSDHAAYEWERAPRPPARCPGPRDSANDR